MYSQCLLVPVLLLLLLILITVPFIYLIITPNNSKAYPVLGHLPQFLKNRHKFHDWITEQLASLPTNTLVFHRPGDTHGVITANPTVIEHVLKTKFESFPKGPRIRSMLQDFLGDGIFNADGYHWKMQRKTASFEFNTKSLRNFVIETVEYETSARLIPLLKEYSKNKQAFDLQDVLERYAFDNVCKVAFNVDPACLTTDPNDKATSNGFAEAFRDAAEYTSGRFRYAIPGFWKIKKILNMGSERRLRESIDVVHEFATNIIRQRMKLKSSERSYDLLSRFVNTEEFSEELLRDIVISFLLAGRETTSSALSWFFWILSSRPDVEQKIINEVEELRKRNNYTKETFSLDELREMQYMHAAITESMRLYPPVPTNISICNEDMMLPDGSEIKKGEFMLCYTYALGRMERVWGKDCREYRPERWLDENGRFRPESPFRFLGFNGGPRVCLGKEMAYIQMKSIVACVVERFMVEAVEKEKCPTKMLSLTLRMKGGLMARIQERRVG